jgi:hypothetical protein
MEIGIRFGPVTNGLRNSPTGSKGRYIQVLATTLAIASTGAMLIVGHEAPCRISALAAESNPASDLQKVGIFRQVSGTSERVEDAVKAYQESAYSCDSHCSLWRVGRTRV